MKFENIKIETYLRPEILAEAQKVMGDLPIIVRCMEDRSVLSIYRSKYSEKVIVFVPKYGPICYDEINSIDQKHYNVYFHSAEKDSRPYIRVAPKNDDLVQLILHGK